MTHTQVQLNADEALKAQAFFAECDGRVQGYAAAMEAAKVMFVDHLIKARPKPAPQPEGDSRG